MNTFSSVLGLSEPFIQVDVVSFLRRPFSNLFEMLVMVVCQNKD